MPFFEVPDQRIFGDGDDAASSTQVGKIDLSGSNAVLTQVSGITGAASHTFDAARLKTIIDRSVDLLDTDPSHGFKFDIDDTAGTDTDASNIEYKEYSNVCSLAASGVAWSLAPDTVRGLQLALDDLLA